MRKQTTIAVCLIASVSAIVIACNQSPSPVTSPTVQAADAALIPNYGGFESQVKWGEHLVQICACNDCHTPKKMGPQGPEPDMDLMLSGHPAQMPPPAIDRKMVESKGLGATQTLTAWVGPWGISYAANITSDSTGIGNWKEEQFIKAIREASIRGLIIRGHYYRLCRGQVIAI